MLIVRINRLLSAVILVSVFAAPAFAQPLGSSFTYQGVLKNGSSPANGLYDARFRLYDALAGGTQVGATLCLDNLGVINGLLTTSLDFGPQFNGAARYLEIEVRADSGLDCNTLAGFTILGPRQALSATPYALHALNASISGTQGGTVSFTNAANTYAGSGAALTNLNASSISSGLLGSAFLGGVYTNALTFASASNVFVGDGSGLVDVDAATLNGFEASDFLQSVPTPLVLSASSPLLPVIGGANSSAAAGVSGVSGVASANGVENYGVYGQSNSNLGYGVRGVANVTTVPQASAGVFDSSSGNVGIGVKGHATGTGGTGILGEVFDPTAVAGVVGAFNATSGFGYGVMGFSNAPQGRGVNGLAMANTGENYGVYGKSNSESGFGVRGVADDSALSFTSAGVYGSSSGESGRGVMGTAGGSTGIGVIGIINNSQGYAGVIGFADVNSGSAIGVQGMTGAPAGKGVAGFAGSGSSENFGVYGHTNSSAGHGVYGHAESNTGATRGVYGISDSTGGRGVQGYATSSTGTNYGVLGRSDSSAGYGVYGQTVPATGTNYAVYASGNSGASGTKSFRIDHPSDPANKYLLHYSAESDEVINFYSGKVTLDGASEAIVDLPAYFALINKDPRYTLTAIGAAMPNLHVALEIDETSLALGERAEPGQAAPPCWFKIAGGVPHAKVSWRVDAVRNDRWMRTHGAPVEIDKQGEERGTYQHPELFGQSAELGMDRATPRPTDVAGDR